MLRGTVLTLLGLGALSLGVLGPDGVFAHNARNAAVFQESQPTPPTKAPLERVRTCPQSIEVGATPWRGRVLAPVDAPARRLCQITGAWTYFRLLPHASQGLATADILVEWDSLNPMHVVVGWGSCFSDARVCPTQSQVRLSDWPVGAPLWVAVLDPQAAGQGGSDAKKGDKKKPKGESSQSDSGTGTQSTEPAGQRFSLGWRAIAKP